MTRDNSPLGPQQATSFEADFDQQTWTFKMPETFEVQAGQFIIMPKEIYDISERGRKRMAAEASLYKRLLREVCVRASLNFPETEEEVLWTEEGMSGELMLDIAAALQLGEVEEQQIHKNRERFEQLLAGLVRS